MPVTRHGRQQRKSGGVATKPEARRIAANIAKLTELRRGKSFTPRTGHRQIGLNVKVDRRETD